MTTAMMTGQRTAWILSKHGHMVLVLTEDDVLLLSQRIPRKADAQALIAKLADLTDHPSRALGPNAVRIPLSDVEEIRPKSSRKILEIETAKVIHRVEGWSKGPKVFGFPNDGFGYSMFGVQAVEDAHQRLTRRRHALLDPIQMEVSDVRARKTPVRVSSLQPDLSDRSRLGEHSVLPKSQLFQYAFDTVVGLAVTLMVVAGSAGLVRYVAGAAAIFVLWLAFNSIPGPLVVNSVGLDWGRGRGRRLVRWENVVWFDRARTKSTRGLLQGHGLSVYVNQSRGPAEILVSPTEFLSRRALDDLLTVISHHRPDCTLTGADVRPPFQPRLPSTKRTKPVVETSIASEPRWKFWLFAVPLAIVVPILMLLPIFASLD